MNINELKESVKNHLETAKRINESLTKMLGDIKNHVVNFKALDEVVQKPEVAVDYRDMDYENKLDFIDGVEPPLEHVTQVLSQAKQLIETLEKDFAAAKKNEDEQESSNKITEINQKLRDDEDLQVLA